jgi:hypothetical protein
MKLLGFILLFTASVGAMVANRKLGWSGWALYLIVAAVSMVAIVLG